MFEGEFLRSWWDVENNYYRDYGIGQNFWSGAERGCSIGDPDLTTQRIPPRIEIAQVKKIQFCKKFRTLLRKYY